jgi:hypothetical protein
LYLILYRALRDAEKAIMFAPQSPKGYYRQGEALRGLKVNSSLPHLGLNLSLQLLGYKKLFFRHQILLVQGMLWQ